MKLGNKEIGFGKQTIAQVFEEWYTVPSYQRHYVWESDNVNDMLDDFASNYIEHAKQCCYDIYISRFIRGCISPIFCHE